MTRVFPTSTSSSTAYAKNTAPSIQVVEVPTLGGTSQASSITDAGTSVGSSMFAGMPLVT